MTERFWKPEGDLFPGVIAILTALIGYYAVSIRRNPAGGELAQPYSGSRIFRVLVWSLRGLMCFYLGLVVYLAAAGGFSLSLGIVKVSAFSLKIPVLTLVLSVILSLLIDRPFRKKILGRLPRLQSPEPRFYVYLLWISFLLALGPIIQVNGREVTYGPYGLLYFGVPGFDGLRAPARFIILVDLALCVLAGFGLAYLLNRLTSPLKKALIVGGVVLPALFEYASFPVNMPSVPTGKDFPKIYHWLAEQPGDFAILEMPIPAVPEDLWREAGYTYFSAYHWKKLVNGYSGFFPPDFNTLYFEKLKGFPDKRTVQVISELGIRYLVIHYKHYPKTERQGILEALQDFHPRIRRLDLPLEAWVFEIHPPVR